MAGISDIINEVFGKEMFKFTSKIGESDLTLVLPAATVLCGGLWLIQLGKDIYSSTQGNGQWKEKTFYSFVKMIIIVAILNTVAVYTNIIMGTLIGGIPEMIAVKLGNLSSEKFIENTIKILDRYSESKNTVGSLINATLDGSAVIQIIASLGFFFMTTLTLVIPLVQKYFFQVCVYLGPFAFAGILCEYTRDVFNKWLSLSLAVSWVMVIYAISMIIFTGDKSPMAIAIAGVENEDVFTVAIATLVSCILMLMSPVFAIYLFGTIGSGIEKINTFGTAVTGVAVSTTKNVIGTAAAKATAMGYNQDGSTKQGTGAADARAAGKAGSIISIGGSSSKSEILSANSAKDSENANKSATASQHIPVIAGASVPKTNGNTSGGNRFSNVSGSDSSISSIGNTAENNTSSNANANENLETRGTSIPTNIGNGQRGANSQNTGTNTNNGNSSQNQGRETLEYSSEYHRQNSPQNMPLEQDIPTINDSNTNINGSIPGKDKEE